MDPIASVLYPLHHNAPPLPQTSLEKSIYNTYDSRDIFIHSAKVITIYSTIYCMQSTQIVKQIALLSIESLGAPSVDRRSIIQRVE